MKKIELGLLFYKDEVEKLEIEADKNGNRPITKEHVDFLREQAKKKLKYKKPAYISSIMQEFNYLIYLFQVNSIPFLLEINTEIPKHHILYIPETFENIDKNQASILYDKTKNWNRFIKNGNKLSIISYKKSEDFLSMDYDEYLLEDLISKLVRVKYGNVFNIGNERRIR